jgi:DNA-binding NtrC family response regulator
METSLSKTTQKKEPLLPLPSPWSRRMNMTKKNILFVDDEENILQGLRRMLRSKRKEWEMYFALGGEQALEIIESQPIHAIVTDMRMPGMDGAKLLHAVMNQDPKIVRIVLSGHSEATLVMSSVLPAHQYLSKPCKAEKLIAVIDHALAMQRLVNNDTVRELAS